MAFKDKSREIAYKNSFAANKYDRLSVLVPKGQKDIIKTAADARGESVNSYINGALQARLEQDKKL